MALFYLASLIHCYICTIYENIVKHENNNYIFTYFSDTFKK